MAIWNWLSFKGHARPEPSSEAAVRGERRAVPRYFSTRVTSCSMVRLPAAVPVPAELRDLSQTGIGLTCHKAVEPGTFLTIQLTGPNQFERTLQACVIHSTVQSETSWAVGCLLTQPLTHDELQSIL